jgi:asparagine synthase (glutamine-hydrolysing)
VVEVADPDAVASDLRRGLEEAVRLHLMSDVPLGLFLSGGIDSSAIAALMAPMLSEPLRTFSVGFEEQEANELAYARLVARHVRAEHREILVSPERFFEVLPLLIWHEDEPIAFPSSVPLYFVSRLAQDHVKVVLTGEGADELFLGYPRYWVTMWNRRLGQLYHRLVPAPLRGPLSRSIDALPWQLRRYLSRTFLRLDLDLRTLFYDNFAVFPTPLLARLLAPAHRDLLQSDVYGTCLAILQASGPGLLEQMAVTDVQTYLVELLMKQDQMSMAASIESRVPFLDHIFVERALRIPGHLRLQGRQTKAIFRAAVGDLLPPSILSRPKMGFPVPIGRWFREGFQHLVDEYILGQRALARGYFDPTVLHQMAMEHRQGRGGHADRLWLLINFEQWQRIFIDEQDPAALQKPPVPTGEICNV